MKMRIRNTFWLIGIFWILSLVGLMANVTTSKGNILFDVNNDDLSEASLTSTGLSIGSSQLPSEKLDVTGNAILTGTASVGGSPFGNHTFSLQGSFGQNIELVSGNGTIGTNSMILADSALGNLRLTLPDASAITDGRIYSLKKTSADHSVLIIGKEMDGYFAVQLTSGNLGSLKVINANNSWYMLSASEAIGIAFPSFIDSFDRADNTNLNAASDGKSGSLGSLSWVEVAGGGANGDPQVVSNELNYGDGAAGSGWSIAYLDYNFSDAIISTGGQFSISVDLVSPASIGGTRFTGFVIGNSKTELDAWSANNPASFSSDFFFGYDCTGTEEVKVFINGGTEDHNLNTNLNAGATLSAKFSGFSDFNAGSSINYEVFIDGSSIKTGTFTWSGNNENYITLYSNYSSNQGVLDNFSFGHE
mgnify:CR=1 FL=1